MELVSLKYTGGKTHSSEPWNRKKFIFKKENNYTCEVPQGLAKELCSERGAGQYIPVKTIVEKEVIKEEKNPLLCDECGFVSKSEYGLLVHRRKHNKKEKIK